MKNESTLRHNEIIFMVHNEMRVSGRKNIIVIGDGMKEKCNDDEIVAYYFYDMM
jgi:hypothetical protein